MKAIYLSGPIQGRSDSDCTDWRGKATELLAPLSVLDPMRHDYRTRYMEPGIAAEIVAADELDTNESQALLVYTDGPSWGTAMEIRYARAERRIPVYTVDVSGRPRSPWLVYHTTEFFDTLEEACAYIGAHHG